MGSQGAKAPVIFILIQWFQVVVFIIPGEVTQIAGGYLFGFRQGLLLSMAGIMVGSACNFLLGKYLGVPFLKSILSGQRLSKYEEFVSKGRSRAAFYLFFVIPGIPKDALCYAAGMWALRFVPFTLISGLCRMPGLIGSVLMGGAAANKRWVLAGSLFLAAVAAGLLAYLFRDRIKIILRRIAGKNYGAGEDGI